MLGAGAEMGPLGPLLRWGATVAAVDLPTPAIWERVLRTAHEAAGRLLVPVAPGTEDAGVDLLAEVPEAADWLAGLDGRLVVGNYLYADGGTHVRVSVAADALASRVTAARPDTALAFLATPTDVFAVPGEAVEHSGRAYAERSGTRSSSDVRSAGSHAAGCCTASTRPAPTPASPTAWCPSRARTTRWPSASSAGGPPPPAGTGSEVSFHVAPSTRTRSVVKNRALAAAFAGAHRFGVEVFDPSTSNTLMAALLVHDLSTGRPPARASLAGRGVRRGARRHLARAVRTPERPRPGRTAGVTPTCAVSAA